MLICQMLNSMHVRHIIIENIDVSIFIEMKLTKILFQRLIHLKKIVIISSYIEMIISIYNVNLFFFVRFFVRIKKHEIDHVCLFY